MVRVILAAVVVVAFVVLTQRIVSADHQTYLPYTPNTWLMQKVITTQEQVWCADARSSAYPNFLTQLRNVNDEYEARVGIRHREVGFGDPACQVKHTMPDTFPCGGAAACIYYANAPVIVAYNFRLGYVDWRSAHGHELGHGLLGMHEFYADSGGSIQCLTNRTWTVMSCGTGVRYPQDFDVQTGCAIIATFWCGNLQPIPEWGECVQYGDGTWGCWNNWGGYWQRTVTSDYRWRPEDQVWRCAERCP